MTNLPTRRFVLSSAATIPALIAIPAAARAHDAEDPKLIVLASEMDAALAQAKMAKERKTAARNVAEQRMPAIPDELLSKAGDELTRCRCAERLTSVEGLPANLPAVFTADGLRFAQEQNGFSQRSSIGRRIKKLVVIAERFETERRAVIVESGWPAAAAELDRCTANVACLLGDLSRARPKTQQGVLILARALSETHSLGESRSTAGVMYWVGVSLAEATVRISSGANRT